MSTKLTSPATNVVFDNFFVSDTLARLVMPKTSGPKDIEKTAEMILIWLIKISSLSSIPYGQVLEAYSGTYVCERSNEHGTAKTTFNVKVKPDTFEAVFFVSLPSFCFQSLITT